MRTARESPGAYGTRFTDTAMAFDVVEANDTEDHYVITISFRPEGAFTGTPGREQFFIEKEGAIALRQVLGLPGSVGWRRYQLLLVGIGLLIVVAATAGGVFVVNAGSGDSEPLAVVLPTITPEQPTLSPTLFSTPMPTTVSPPIRNTLNPIASPEPTMNTSSNTTTAQSSNTTTAQSSEPSIPAGSIVDISYYNSLYLSEGGREFEEDWDPSISSHSPRWDNVVVLPAHVTVTVDEPLRLSSSVPPLTSSAEAGVFTYSWGADSRDNHADISTNLRRVVSADSGLEFKRKITPDILAPGTTRVVIEASAEILRPPSIDRTQLTPIGGILRLSFAFNSLAPGVKSRVYPGVLPLSLVSFTGTDRVTYGPIFDIGKSFDLRVEAVIENPNPFPVNYVPLLASILDLDIESVNAPFKVITPTNTEFDSSSVAFHAVGVTGENVTFEFVNPSGEPVTWIYQTDRDFGGFKGIWQTWDEHMQVSISSNFATPQPTPRLSPTSTSGPVPTASPRPTATATPRPTSTQQALATPTPVIGASQKTKLKIAGLNWTSAQIQNGVALYVLEHGYGFTTEVVNGQTATLFQAIIDHNIDIAMEIWLPNQTEIWFEALKNNEIISAGKSLEDNWQSTFVVPTYVVEQNPGLESVFDIPAHIKLFAQPDSRGKAVLIGCLAVWACNRVNREQIVAYGLEEAVELRDPGSVGGLFGSLE